MAYTTKQDVSNYGWFADKVCICPMYKYRGPQKFNWSTFEEYKFPPECGDCGKWLNQVMTCAKCEEKYYQFFNHPRMGYHEKPRRGWYCWNDLQTYLPPEVQTVWKNHPITPPPAMVLPPGYELVQGVGYR